MFRHHAIVFTALVALSACGSSSDPADEADGGSTSTPDGGSTSTPDGGSSTPDGGSTAEPVRTATITLGAQSWTVTPEVRRGLLRTPDPVYFLAEANKTTRSVTLTCAPGATPAKGGRRINIQNVAAFSTGSALCEGGGLIDARFAVNREARAACNGKTTCTVDLYQAFHGTLWGCGNHSPETISFDYECVAQTSFAPAMVFEYASDDVSVSFSGLDGEGSASCAERAMSSLAVAGYTVAGEGCRLDLTRRTGSDVAGTLTATLLDAQGTAVPLSVTFTHERNTLRPSLIFATSTMFCGSNALTHTTAGTGADAVDTIVAAGPFACQSASGTSSDPVTIELSIKRPTTAGEGFSCGERLELRVGDKSTSATAQGGGCMGGVMDEEPRALRAWLSGVQACSAEGCRELGTVFMNYGYAPVAVP